MQSSRAKLSFAVLFQCLHYRLVGMTLMRPHKTIEDVSHAGCIALSIPKERQVRIQRYGLFWPQYATQILLAKLAIKIIPIKVFFLMLCRFLS
jgi:hypothetical protein